MASLGTMTAYVGLDYSNLARGCAYSKSQLADMQSYTVRVQGATGSNAGRVAASAVVAVAAMGRSSRGMFGGLVSGTGSVIGSLGRMGIAAAGAYGSWRLHSLRMRNELMQNTLLQRMMGQTPGAGSQSLMWMRQMNAGAKQTRFSMMGLVGGTVAVAGAITAIGGAAVLAYGQWRMQSAKIKTELLQQKLLTEQLKQMRQSGGAASTGRLSGGGMGGGGLGMLSMGGLAGGAAAYAAVSGVKHGVGLAAEAEQSQIAFEVMLGSAQKATGMLAQLKGYADASPFNVSGVNQAAQKLLNYNVQAQDVLPTIRMLGDVAAGDMEKFDRLSTAFGQMTATGRLMGQDLLQFINAGFNPLQEISKKTGESMSVLKKRMEDGGISAMEVNDAFKAATSSGGRFENMTARQSKTIVGRWSTMKDSIDSVLRELGEALVTRLDLGGWIEYATAVINQLPFVFRNAGSLIQIAILDWNIYLAELLPGADGVMQELGAIFVAGWDGSVAGFVAFKDNLLAGFVEIKNIALALWEAIKAGMDAAFAGKNPLAAAKDALIKTFAEQKDAGGGKPFYQAFQDQYQETLKNAKQGLAERPQGSYVQEMKDQKEQLLDQVAADEAALKKPEMPKADEGKVGASFNASTEDKDKDKKSAAKAESSAALIATAEAAKIMTSQQSNIPSKQLKVLESIEKKIGPKPLAPPAQSFTQPLSPMRLEVTGL